MTQPVDAPQRSVLSLISTGLVIFGLFGVIVGLFAVGFSGVALTVAGAVLLTGGLLVTALRSAMLWWEIETRQAAFTAARSDSSGTAT